MECCLSCDFGLVLAARAKWSFRLKVNHSLPLKH